MREYINTPKDTYQALYGLVVYGTKQNNYNEVNYVEYYDVRGNKTCNHRPVTKETLKLFSIMDSDVQLIGCSKLLKDVVVLKMGQNISGPEIIFYHKPRYFTINSTSKDIPNGRYKFPATMYKYINGELYIAFMSNNQYNKNTKFHYPPFWNTYADAKRCTGNNDMKRIDESNDYYEMIQDIINISWNSRFNDHLKNESNFLIPLKDIYEKQEFIKYSKEINFL